MDSGAPFCYCLGSEKNQPRNAKLAVNSCSGEIRRWCIKFKQTKTIPLCPLYVYLPNKLKIAAFCSKHVLRYHAYSYYLKSVIQDNT